MNAQGAVIGRAVVFTGEPEPPSALTIAYETSGNMLHFRREGTASEFHLLSAAPADGKKFYVVVSTTEVAPASRPVTPVMPLEQK